MFITGKVINVKEDERDLVGKDGVKKHAKVSHVLLMCGTIGKDPEVVNLRGYDVEWKLPKVGDEWTSPRVRRYENYDGQVAEVTV